ncbi:SDR family NAD(P)-dependent oxidoreductase [Amnibacterium kyonggiense]
METATRVLITGGSSGIGLGLARRFAASGADVIITGRSQDRVDAVAAEVERVTGIAGDLADPRDRISLAAAVGEVDVLINNAGIQRRVGLAEDHSPWEERQRELDLLLAAPMHLTDLLLPAILRQGRPATIVNVTSGGAFIPQPFAVGYSAAKAALHSYTLNLRHALASTSVRVVELIPPAVATGLSGLKHPHGADIDDFCDTAFAALQTGALEIGFGPTADPEFTDRLQLERDRFERSAGRFPVPGYRS